MNLVHRLALNHRVDWNTCRTLKIGVTGIFTARAGSPIGLVHQNHWNSRNEMDPERSRRFSGPLCSGRGPLLGVISGCGLDPDGSLAQ